MMRHNLSFYRPVPLGYGRSYIVQQDMYKHVFPDMSYQLTQTLKQHALAASCVGYLVPAGARIDQKTDQCNRGMLLLIAIKSDLSGPLSLSFILFMGQLE